MKRLIFGILLIGSPAWAANLCTTVTAAEVDQLTDAATRQGTTNQIIIDNAIHGTIASGYNAAIHQSLSGALENAWTTFGNAKKTNICTSIGVSPCPP